MFDDWKHDGIVVSFGGTDEQPYSRIFRRVSHAPIWAAGWCFLPTTPQVGSLGSQMRRGTSATNVSSSSSLWGSLPPGRIQWQEQCETSGERSSAYAQAQKLWGGIRTCTAPRDRLYSFMADFGTELAMRGQAHVLDGPSRGARQAFKNWRAQVRNISRNVSVGGQQVSALYDEYEEAPKVCKAINPAMDMDEDHRWRLKKRRHIGNGDNADEA